VRSGRSSSDPTACSRQRPVAASSRTASSMMPSRFSSSSAGRLRLSVDSIQSVTTSTPTSSLHDRTSPILSAPARCPRAVEVPIERAHRRLPSRITPMWRGMRSDGSDAASRRSYSP